MVPIGSGAGAYVALALLEIERMYKVRFERRGIEFTRGFLAAKYGRKPRWLNRILGILTFSLACNAARSVMLDAGLDPWDCGDEFFDDKRNL